MAELTSRELLRAAMRRQPTERIPSMPQISYHSSVRIFGPDSGGDWLSALQRCIEDPAIIYDHVIRLVEEVDCDGLRLFVPEKPMRVERVGRELIVLDQATGQRIGCVDTMGGGGVVPDRPAAPVETLNDAKDRLNTMVQDFTDEKMESLRQARERVPDRFVASWPGCLTIGTFSTLRGPVQAMTDLFDRPELVMALMDMQAEAMIQRAEKLLTTGIDAIYISEPSASLISPGHFERFCLSAIQKFCRHFKDRGVLIYIHVCGNSNPILEMLADSGVDVVEPLDPMGGVSVADAKRRIGGKVALMGGLSTNTLRWGSAEDVRMEAIQKCREGGPDGYILAAGCQVPPETPLENLRAMVGVAMRSQWKQ